MNVVQGTPVSAKVTTGGFVYSRVTKTFVGRVTVMNTGGTSATGPLSLVFRKLPAGVTLVQPSGTIDTEPYLTFSLGNLGAGSSTSFYVQFNATTGITFTPVVLSGKLQ